MQLRKVCCHPFLFPGTEDDPDETPLEELSAASGKLLVLEKLLDQLRAAGHRVCLFSQFTAVLNILEDFVRLRDYSHGASRRWWHCRVASYQTAPMVRGCVWRRVAEVTESCCWTNECH